METYKIEIGDSTCFGDESAKFILYLNNLGHNATETNSGGNYVDDWRADNEECPLDIDQLWSDYCDGPGQTLAEKTIEILRNKFQVNMSTGGYVAIDNSELHDELNDSCVFVKDILDQETWIMSDGSYITRNDDIYWIGDDVADFEITEEIQNENKNNESSC